MKSLIAILAAAALGGCASFGRFSVAEWDSRDEVQIRASAEELSALQSCGGDACGVAREARAFSAWAELFDMVTKLKVRLRIISVEWGASK